MGPPGEGEEGGREREGGGRWDSDPSTRDRKGGAGNGGNNGGGRVGRGREGGGGEGQEISIHGLKLVAPPMSRLFRYVVFRVYPSSQRAIET